MSEQIIRTILAIHLFTVGLWIAPIAAHAQDATSTAAGHRAHSIDSQDSHHSAPGDYSLDTLAATQSKLILELTLGDYSLVEEIHNGRQFHVLSAEGMTLLTAPGKPQIPSVSKLIGIPDSGIAQIEILALESQSVFGISLSPMPWVDDPTSTLRAASKGIDSHSYVADAVTPSATVRLGTVGKLREQSVAQVIFNPFQYNPVKQELTVHHTIQVSIQFHQSPMVAAASSNRGIAPSAFEEIYRSSLLNYASLPRSQVHNEATSTADAASMEPGQANREDNNSHSERLKIVIDDAGMYRVSYAWIKSIGFNLDDIDPAYLQMHHLGEEIAFYVHGEADGIVNAGDWISFYGQASTSPFDTENAYWLSVGAAPGLRMAEEDGSVADEVDPTEWYRRFSHWETDQVYWKDLPLEVDGEHNVAEYGSDFARLDRRDVSDFWFWERYPSAPAEREYSFWLSNVIDVSALLNRASAQARAASLSADREDAIMDTAGGNSVEALKGLITVRLQGRTETTANPDHHTKIFLNNTKIDDILWDGQIALEQEVIVPQSLFREGENVLKVEMPGDTESAVDSIYFDSFDVTYWAEKVAFENQIEFPGLSGEQAYGVVNFSKPGIEIYNISNPLAVKKIVNGNESSSGSSYRIKFADSQPSAASYLAIQSSAKRTPLRLEIVAPSRWKLPQNRADYLIITHPDFMDAIAPLATYRRANGLSVETIDVNQLYDEFGYGISTPLAVRDFIDYAYHNWQSPAPLYVLLVGDANYDYKDFLGGGYTNYVPTALFNSPVIGQTPTDNWFVSVSGDDFLPDLHVGRIAVSQPEEIDTAVNKILAYEAMGNSDSWIEQSLFVAEDEANFQAISDQLIEQLPYTYRAERVYGSDYPAPPDARLPILESIDQGLSLITYIGHGSITGWYWDEQILDITDISELQNGPHYPFLITGSCNNGLFAHPDKRVSFAEEFINTPGKGGIGVWSPTGLGYTFWHEKLIEALYAQFFDDFVTELGPATTAAKIQAYGQLGWREPVEISTLFGDPALSLHISKPEIDVVVKPITAQATAGEPYQYAITVTNRGVSTLTDVQVTVVLDNASFQWSIPIATSSSPRWIFDELPAGSAKIIIMTVNVDQQVTESESVTIAATLSSQGQAIETELSDTIIQVPQGEAPLATPTEIGTPTPSLPSGPTPLPGTPGSGTPTTAPAITPTPNGSGQVAPTPSPPGQGATPVPPLVGELPASLLYLPIQLK